MPHPSTTPDPPPPGHLTVRRLLTVSGRVQGVGFRPWVHRLATSLQLTGQIRNQTDGVRIEIQGTPNAVAEFLHRLPSAPSPARVDHTRIDNLPTCPESQFVINPSAAQSAAATIVPADLAPCPQCLAEFADPANRRHHYPFIHCPACGPRLTLLRAMPFDRANTAMADFTPCPLCQAEYANPSDRRFHSQTICCPQCGPRYSLHPDRNAPPIDQAQSILRQGGILAIRGVGGYHLACDATNHQAVLRLRKIKKRDAKPFACLAHDLPMVHRYARVNPAEAKALLSPERPIVLLLKKNSSASAPALAPEVAPGLATIGFLLPYSPLHLLLLDEHPLVFTSANHSGEPLIIDAATAQATFKDSVDAFLHHDRDITVRCDDSVVTVQRHHATPVRRSRGFAPLPVEMPWNLPPLLAVGGELKSTFCLAQGHWACLGPHIGDMAHPEIMTAMDQAVAAYRRFLGIRPQFILCDAHPGYLSRRWASDYAQQNHLPLFPIQHHAAHVASLLADSGHTGPLIAVCFDGAGHGPDDSIWGGEWFQWQPAAPGGPTLKRAAHLKYVPQPGGDAAALRVNRMALAHLHAAGIPWQLPLAPLEASLPTEMDILASQLQNPRLAPTTSSVGRLFDAVASLVGISQVNQYEAQAAMRLEDAALRVAPTLYRKEPLGYPFALLPGEPAILDPTPLFQAQVADLQASVPAPVIAWRFHAGLATAVRDVCVRLRDRDGTDTVGLTGGVFQNALLARLARNKLRAAGFQVLLHRQAPCNDGGIALGQAAWAGLFPAFLQNHQPIG